MKPRYFSKAVKPKSEEYYDCDDYSTITDISVCDHEAVETGLLDADGNPIFRAPNGMGFGVEL